MIVFWSANQFDSFGFNGRGKRSLTWPRRALADPSRQGKRFLTDYILTENTILPPSDTIAGRDLLKRRPRFTKTAASVLPERVALE